MSWEQAGGHLGRGLQHHRCGDVVLLGMNRLFPLGPADASSHGAGDGQSGARAEPLKAPS